MRLSAKIQARLNDRLVLRINELYHDLENAFYDVRHAGMHAGGAEFWNQNLKNCLPQQGPRTILDYGCGTGYVSQTVAPLLSPEDTLVFADISREMLGVCESNLRDRGAACRLVSVKIAGTGMPLANGSVDLIALNSVLHHLPDLGGFARECRRLLKPGGLLLAGHEPNGERADYPAVFRADLLARALQNPAYFIERLVERSPWLERALRRMLSHTSASYRRRNAMLREIAGRLREEGLIDLELRGTEIQQIVDIHTEHGFREAELMHGPFRGFERMVWTTRGFVSGRGALFRKWNSRCAARYPRAGTTLSFVLKRL